MDKLSNNNTKHHSTKPKWDWMQVDCNLKTQQNRKYALWSLAPSIVLTNPSGDGPDPNVKLYIDTEKSLQFSEELGWNWHKSWNLPNISIRVQIKDVTTGESLLAPKNLYAQLFAVKVVVDPHEKNQNAHLVDVGIRGSSKIQMVDGQAYFTAIKFLSTSYNNQGVKFYLLLALYINNGQNESPKILTATLSPPIFVDSRKSARDNQQKKYSSFIEPFLVENLEKQFIKRENKRKNEHQIKIKNDFEGLFNYLTAPNIRHKVKHPIFIAIKFNNCTRLYFNVNLLPKTTSINQSIITLQKKISKDHTSRRSTKTQTKIDDKIFILLIKESNDSFKNKKIQESIDPLECNSLGIIYNQEHLPPFFENINILGNISTAYKEEYSQLYLIAKSIMNIDNTNSNESDEEQSQSENGSSEEQSQSPIPTKKLRFLKKYQSQSQQLYDHNEKIEAESNKKQPISNHINQLNNNSQNNNINSKKLQQPTIDQSINKFNSNQESSNNNINNQILNNIPQNLNNPNNQLNQQNITNNPLENLLMNNMLFNNPLNNLKLGGMYQNNQQSNLLNLVNESNNSNLSNNIGSNLTGLNQNKQQSNLLSNLLNNSYNPMNNLSSLANLSSLGNHNQLNQMQNNLTNNNLLANQITNPTQKIGFSPTIQSVQLNQVQQMQQNQVQQTNQQNQSNQQNLNQNSQQTNLILLQQLAIYKQLLTQITLQNQFGLNIGSLLPGLGNSGGLGGLSSGLPNLSSGLGQSLGLGGQGLNQGLSQNLNQILGQSSGLGGLGNLGFSGLGNFGSLFPPQQNQQNNQLEMILKMMQMKNEQKQTKKEQK